MRRNVLVALTLLLGSSAAHADKNTNLGYLNTANFNLGYLNLGYLNLGYLNLGYLNGGQADSVTLSKMKHENGQFIDNVALERDYLTGWTWIYELDYWGRDGAVYAWHYKKIQKAAFTNATFEATVSEVGETEALGKVTVRIAGTKTSIGADSQTYYQHYVEYLNPTTSAYEPVCGCENGDAPCTPVPATLVQGAWNYSQGTEFGGSKISNDPNVVTIACGNAAIAKCAADKSVLGPSTPAHASYVTVPNEQWNHRGAFPVFPGTTLTVKTISGSGDLDLYVRWNAQPTRASYACRQTGSTSTETCTINVPTTARTAYVSLYGYAAGTSTATLQVTSTSGAPRGMGYKPWRPYNCFYLPNYGMVCYTPPPTQHQACTRMVTADYCGDGSSHTISGRPIEVFDFYNPQVNTDTDDGELYWEGEWTAQGANWVGTCRVEDLQLSEAKWDECPSYNGQTHDVATYKPIYSGGQVVGCDGSEFANPNIEYNRAGYLYNKNTGTFYPPQPRGSSRI